MSFDREYRPLEAHEGHIGGGRCLTHGKRGRCKRRARWIKMFGKSACVVVCDKHAGVES